MQLIQDLNWTFQDINLIINKMDKYNMNANILDQLEKSVSLIIAFNLKFASHNGGLSLKLIIENYEINNWYDSIYDIAINTGFPDSVEKQKQDLIDELLKTNKGNPRIMSYVHEKLLGILNRIDNTIERGRSNIVDLKHTISQWRIDDIKNWSDTCKKSGRKAVIDNMNEVIAVICQAAKL